MEDIFEDDLDILEILEFGFPRRIYDRADYFDSIDNMTFYRRFRLTKATAEKVVDEIHDQLEVVDWNNSVSPMNQFLAALRFYSCGNHQDEIGDFMGMHQSTASRIIKKVSVALASLRPQYIRMPEGNEIYQIQNGFYQMARFPSVIGCVDGTHIKIQSPGGEDAEIFRNRKSYFSINTQVVCDSSLKIREIVARWPGSAHDLTMFNNSRVRARLEAGEFHRAVILGDSEYTDRPYLMVPVANPVDRAEQLYNQSLIRTRNTVERQIGVWKRRFPALLYGLRCKLELSFTIIVATAVLHNIALAMNEADPPPLENIGEDHLDYLIQLGNIPGNAVNDVERLGVPRFNNRANLIRQYFAHL